MDESNPYEPSSTDAPLDPLEVPPTQEECNLALIAHLSGIAGVFGAGLLGFVGPLIIYLWKNESSPYVGSQAKEALNFQITLFILAAICIAVTAVSCGVLFPIVLVPMILQLVFGIIAALAVRDGQHYRYPFNWRIIQ